MDRSDGSYVHMWYKVLLSRMIFQEHTLVRDRDCDVRGVIVHALYQYFIGFPRRGRNVCQRQRQDGIINKIAVCMCMYVSMSPENTQY